MAATSITSRVARLERSVGDGGTCPRHDVAIRIQAVKDGVTTVAQEPEARACRWCGRPPRELRFVIETIDDRPDPRRPT